MVSSEFGNDEVRRQRTWGLLCATAGAARPAVAATPTPARVRNERRSKYRPPLWTRAAAGLLLCQRTLTALRHTASARFGLCRRVSPCRRRGQKKGDDPSESPPALVNHQEGQSPIPR